MNEPAGAVDLHTHSTASDGVLDPQMLVRRAQGRGVRLLALTDHDTTAGIGAAREAARTAGITLVAGIELSTLWASCGLHVLGLGVDPAAAPLRQLEADLARLRETRAQRIAQRLSAAGIEGALGGALRLAAGGQVTRSHFARHLVEAGAVASGQEAFKRYLGRGGKAFVRTEWPDLEQILAGILGAGGLPVLAHPLAYRLSASRMRRLLAEFRELGGVGIEVVCGGYSRQMQQNCASLALRYELCGSVGSDFHTPETPWRELGPKAALPLSVTPVWTRLPLPAGFSLRSDTTP